MISQTVENLDFYCTDYARRVTDALLTGPEKVPGDDVAHMTTRLLNVLHQNGLYATLLYIVWKRHNGTRREQRVAGVIEDMLVGRPGQSTLLRLSEMGFRVDKAEDSLTVGQAITKSLDAVFLAKELINRTLTYVRYHAKSI
jgi:hypothetical protein